MKRLLNGGLGEPGFLSLSLLKFDVLSRRNSVTLCPLVTSTMLAMPMNRPCSTIPGISLSLRANDGGRRSGRSYSPGFDDLRPNFLAHG